MTVYLLLASLFLTFYPMGVFTTKEGAEKAKATIENYFKEEGILWFPTLIITETELDPKNIEDLVKKVFTITEEEQKNENQEDR